MRDIISILERWTSDGTAIAVGSVIERIGSAPRDPGATLAVSGAGEVAGSVTGGCVEPAVIREATEVLNGSPGRICRYGLSDDEGFDVGLTCGGSIAVAVYALDPALVPQIADAVATDTSIAMTVRLERRALRRAAARPRRPARRDRARPRRAVAARARRERHRRAARRRARLRRVVRAAARHVHLRRERPRHRARDDGQVPRLPRHRLRRPRDLPHRGALPRRRRARRSSGPTASSRRRRSIRAPRSA